MEEKILRSIKRYIPDLVDMALKERPNADRGSVEVAAAVSLLIATIYLLNIGGRFPGIEATIDAIVERLPRSMDERSVSLSQAILDPETLESASQIIYGAYNTNLLGAFEAIYNARLSNDIKRMGTMVNGPLGQLGGVCIVTGEALIGQGKTPDMFKLIEIFNKHLSNISAALTATNSGSGSAGSKACFVATACFDSPNHQTVVTLRRFRETVLKKNSFGRALVKDYYKISPPLAVAIRRYPVFRYPVAIVLKLVAVLLRSGFRLD